MRNRFPFHRNSRAPIAANPRVEGPQIFVNFLLRSYPYRFTCRDEYLSIMTI